MDYIDVHAHGFPEAYLRQLAATYPTEVQVEEASGDTPMVTRWSKAPLPSWDIERRLEEMNRDGVAVEILSAPPVYSHLDIHTAGFCRHWPSKGANTVLKRHGSEATLSPST